MKLKHLALSLSFIFSGCTTFDFQDDMLTQEPIDNRSNNESGLYDPNATPLQSSMAFQQQFKDSVKESQKNPETNIVVKTNQQQFGSPAKHNINHYARGIMQDLVSNLQYVNSTTPVAVVSFVMLDSNYNQGNLLGNQLAESLIHEVHKFGIPVVDYKTTGYIRITETGDFAFSKDYLDFEDELPARYLVGGTMLKHTDGYLINARIIGMSSKAVVATAQSFIPNHVSDPILAMSKSEQSNNLTSGEEMPISDISYNNSQNRVNLIQE